MEAKPAPHLVTVLFNVERGYRFSPWQPGVTMDVSKYFRKREYPGSFTHGEVLNWVWGEGNADERPNGKYERSISVGDVIVLETADGRVPYAVEPYGWKQLTPDEAQTIKLNDWE